MDNFCSQRSRLITSHINESYVYCLARYFYEEFFLFEALLRLYFCRRLLLCMWKLYILMLNSWMNIYIVLQLHHLSFASQTCYTWYYKIQFRNNDDDDNCIANIVFHAKKFSTKLKTNLRRIIYVRLFATDLFFFIEGEKKAYWSLYRWRKGLTLYVKRLWYSPKRDLILPLKYTYDKYMHLSETVCNTYEKSETSVTGWRIHAKQHVYPKILKGSGVSSVHLVMG